jgi:YD repeat-containing protein
MNKSAKKEKRFIYLVALFLFGMPFLVFSGDVVDSWCNCGENPIYYYHHINTDDYKLSDDALVSCNAEIKRYDPSLNCTLAGTANTETLATGGWAEDINNERHFHLFSYYYPLYFGVFENSCPVIVEGNPVDPATGVKIEKETDYVSANGSLQIDRYFTTLGSIDGFNNMGYGWRHNFTGRINGYGILSKYDYKGKRTSLYNSPSEACESGWSSLKSSYKLLYDSAALYINDRCEIKTNNQTVAYMRVYNTRNGNVDDSSPLLTRYLKRSSGKILVMRQVNGQWKSLYPGQGTMVDTQNGTEYRINGSIEMYDEEGRLASSLSASGYKTQYTYDESTRLASVIGHFGDVLTFHYDDEDQLNRIVTPDGEIKYGYDTDRRLIKVTWPDDSERHYHYEKSIFPNHLTGITDENGNRFATWKYDYSGKATSSEHGGALERVRFRYNSDGSTRVTDAKGATRAYHFTVQQGQMKVDRIEGDRCTTCSGGDIQAYTYGSNGFIASKTDWNGNTTTYTRDDQGSELSHTEASGTPQARTIIATWDVALNKPLTVTGPEQITEYIYDGTGRMVSTIKSEIQ